MVTSLKSEVGMVVQKSTQIRVVGIITYKLHENSEGLSSQPIPNLGVSHPVPAQAPPA